MQFLSGLMLVPTQAKQGGEVEVSMTITPDSQAGSVNVGDTGVVVSTLRPAGRAKFGEAVVDVVAEAAFLETGTKVKITAIYGNRVVVKEQ
jgi:membrane-bound serine protease (ClpP class)